MLRAVGLTDEDWNKPQIGIANAWNEVTPCNASLRRLAACAKTGVRNAGGVALEFGTITVSDGISMGHEGMRASLVSREIICDSVETVVHAERFAPEEAEGQAVLLVLSILIPRLVPVQLGPVRGGGIGPMEQVG